MIQQAYALYQATRFDEALGLAVQALAETPGNADWLNFAAACCRALSLPEPAENYWRKAIAVQPGYAAAHNNLGILLKEQRRYAESEAHYRQAIALLPGYAEAHVNLGALLTETGRIAEAEASYRRSLEALPESAELRYGLGLALAKLNRPAEAEASYRQALALRPGHADVRHRLGILLQEQGRDEAAAECFRQVIELSPGFAEAYSRMGVALKSLGRDEEAEASYRRALALRPDYPTVLGNLGALLSNRNRCEEAEACFLKAIGLQPDIAEVHYNLGMMLHRLHRHAEAEACYRRALDLRPGYVGAEWNLSALLLLLGKFEEGWRRYEIRYHAERHGGKPAVPDLPFPQWQGQSLAGKSLLVWPEQGFGDAIQFCRYLAILKRRGAARITLVCKPPLKPLLDGLEGADAVAEIAEAPALPPHDFWTLILSLPLHCGTGPDNIPAALPYLRPSPERLERWAPRLRNLAGLRIGLVWKGSATNGNDQNRSLPGLETLAPLWEVPGLSFVSLQKGNGENQAARPPPDQPLLALGPELRDFADTAAVLAQIDLLISVDTAIAHLAGALGRPCWVLLPSEGLDWRWQRGRSDSPWYPGVMRLFRQDESGDWAPVVTAIAAELRNFRPGQARPGIDRIAAKLGGLSADDLRLVGALIDRLSVDSESR